MSNIPLRFDRVSKKFRRGELYDSLRDLIPAAAARLIHRGSRTSRVNREFWALRDVSFRLSGGDALGIIGPNGAGKSTILKILSGIMQPTSGSVSVQGRLSALIEVGAGFHPDLTGRENVILNGVILGMSRREIRSKFDQIVEFSGLREFIDTPVKRYSSGMYARLGFSVAAHVDPDLLIVDEVLSVGDWAFQKRCMDKMAAVMTSGTTVVFVSHNLRAVTELCPKALLLERGQVVAVGASGDVVRRYLLGAAGVQRDVASKRCYISNVLVRDSRGATSQFCAGDPAWIDISIKVNADCSSVALLFYISDEKGVPVSNTSTERLGYAPFELKAEQEYHVTLAVSLHLARGTFTFAFGLKRYDIDETYDEVPNAYTIFITSNCDVRGAANVYPKLVYSGPAGNAKSDERGGVAP